MAGQGVGLRSLQTSTTNAVLIPTFGGATTRHTITIPPNTSSIDLTLIAYNPTAAIRLVKVGEEATDYFAGKGSRGSVSIPVAPDDALSITVREPDIDPIAYRVVVTTATIVTTLPTLPPCTLNILDNDGDSVDQALDIDKDNDGLIEICDLEGLDEMRHQLDGSGYRANEDAFTITDGCPDSGCTGYELTRSLDFRDDNSYRILANMETYTLTTLTAVGWQPIGSDASSRFSAMFNGNGYTISNLITNQVKTTSVGLFGYTGNSEITNLGLLSVTILGNADRAGSLVGFNNGRITNSYATGYVQGVNAGGLAGRNEGTIANSYATCSVSGTSTAGGLVGLGSGTVMNSYWDIDISGVAASAGGTSQTTVASPTAMRPVM